MAPRDTFVKGEARVPSITPLQLRLARTALRLGIRELADAAGVSPTTVTRFESGRGGVHSGTLASLEAVLEKRGIVFVAADGTGGATIRLKE
ncbi:MAG: helix-turn-helix transcriptional regulator [Pseudomonadota bacterium]